jgi:hypothetical protein
MTLSVAKDCLEQRIRCNLSPAHVQIPFVDRGVLNLLG